MTRDAANGLEEDSCDLPDIAAARRSAILFAGDVLQELGGDIYHDALHIVVTDDAGTMCWDLRVTGVEGPGATRD